jgi:signal transduction histidine kinase
MLGVPKVQLLGSTCHKFICPAEIGACPITDRHETVDNSERLLIKGNDERLPILKSVVPLERKGKTLLIESFIDISQRKRAEEKLQLFAREVQEINEEMRNFAYIVSHDLRAPLVSIKGFSSELDSSIKEMRPLLDKCVASLNEKERKRLDLILQEDIGEALGFIGSSVNRMDGLISNILNLSRLGRKELKIEPVDMTEITRAILASLAHQIEEKRVTVTLAELPELVADKISMEQIMGNLIDNALKYLEPERDGALSITADRAKDGVTFQVRDNGRGIAQEDMHKVFELFRRAGKQDTKGEGMGLAYVKTLVRRHGGRIWCESAPGVGSTFSFSIAAAVRQG